MAERPSLNAWSPIAFRRVKPSDASHSTFIPWHRFWCPLGGVIHCGDDGASFLTDPEDDFGRHANPQVARLSALLPDVGPLVLCGEPGIGKSTDLAAMRASLEAESGGPVIWIVFRDIADAADFRRQTVDSNAWREWRAGAGRLTLVVDGVDEGLLRVPNFVNDLTALLKDEPIARLRLVLACRTAEWPLDAGRRFLSLWSDEKRAAFYELCPLRRVDAELAATTRGADSVKFLEAVWQRGVTGLAARPVTLFFLLREFRHGELPATHRELYERGTENLALEISPARLELLRSLRKTERHCSNADRVDAARRLAALLLLTGRSAIRQSGAAFEDVPPRDLPLDAAGDGAVSPEAAAEAIESALFTSLGERRFGFAHQTFAECLAAQHLAPLPLVQLRRLTCQRDARGEHVIPQLAELAAWTAGIHHAFCEHLLHIEPEILLRSDVTRLQGGLKARLVAALLAGAEREEIFDDFAYSRFFDGLRHSGLAEQLGQVITNKQAHFIARRIALKIAGHCRVHELTDLVLAMVNDPADGAHLRDQAADALEELIPDDRLALLEPLARGEIEPDRDDTIKGCALRRLIPAHWKVRDALPHLTPQKNDMFLGTYQMFLSHSLPKLLEDEDLAPILAFVRPRRGCLSSLGSFHDLAAVAFAKALERLDVPSIAEEVGNTWHTWLKQRELHHLKRDSALKVALEDEETRRKLAAIYLNDSRTESNETYRLQEPIPILQGTDDLRWLLNELPTVAAARRPVWAMMIAQFTANAKLAAPCWDLLLERIAQIPELAALYDWMRAWELNEPTARRAKARWLCDHRKRKRHEREMAEFATPDPLQGISAAFGRFAEGDHQAWVSLWSHLASSEDGNHQFFWECDVTKYPNWKLLSEEDQAACRRIARAFLISEAPRAHEYQKLSSGALAAGVGVRLLHESLPVDAELRAATAGPWLHSLVGHGGADADCSLALFALAYELSPLETITQLLQEAEEDAQKHRHPFAFRAGARCWDSQLSEACSRFLAESCDPKMVLKRLDELAQRDRASAVNFAATVLDSIPSNGSAYPVHALAAAVAALTYDAGRQWAKLKKFLETDENFARSVFGEVCYGMDDERKEVLAQLSEQELAEFCLLLHQLYPVSGDPPRNSRGGFVSQEECARRVRGQIPGILAARASEEACAALLYLTNALPSQTTWFRLIYRDAVVNVRRILWQPPSPDAVKRMLAQPRARLLNSDDDLLELALESLGRLQTKLTAQMLPAVEDLWRWDGSGNARTKFQPKDEEALSDYIARWLADDIGPAAGVVVGREVQPRRGLRTDVIIEAAPPAAGGGFEKFTVVIEVKGCWHGEVRTALRTQLADDYLRPHGLRCGIYLVGWFVCARWAGAKNHLASATTAAARAEIEAFAVDFSDGKSDLRIAPCLLDCTF